MSTERFQESLVLLAKALVLLAESILKYAFHRTQLFILEEHIGFILILAVIYSILILTLSVDLFAAISAVHKTAISLAQ
jgi:hypothetical protein